MKCVSKAWLYSMVTLMLVAILGLLSPSSSRAYSEPLLFAEDTVEVGGGGQRWFTGSTRDGLTCSVCHRNASHLQGVRLQGVSLDGEQVDSGDESTYEITLSWPLPLHTTVIVGDITDERGHGLGQLVSQLSSQQEASQRSGPGSGSGSGSGFGSGSEQASSLSNPLADLDDSNPGRKSLRDPALPQVDLFEANFGRKIFSFRSQSSSSTKIWWTAPHRMAEKAFLNLSIVAGDGSNTAESDEVYHVRRRISEIVDLNEMESEEPASPTTIHPRVTVSCAIDPESKELGYGLSWFNLLAILFMVFGGSGVANSWDHRRQWLRSALIFLVVLGSACFQFGCSTVMPHQRGRLAKKDMQFTLSPSLSFGSNHANDYREGASGGFGGGGGGCGCN